ncbi:hypothetical protein [Psychromonas sp. SP041]|uniref:hypothetical protein n=1 Tax=Psychromonas sp. SP041 TaxID=1365007 RepID=UPI00041356C0|nr:hypothetical protein [Psychromonas sp. SP041]
MYPLNNFKFARLLLLLVFGVTTFSAPLSAHDLNETSAQVILRDGQVEVKIITDINYLVSRLQNNQAWLMGDIEKVMPDNLSDNEQQIVIKKTLKQGTHLMLNNQMISFERVTLTNDNDQHSVEIVLQAKHQFKEVVDISVSFDKSLGVVHASFVKPRYRLVGLGERAEVSF